MFQSMPHLNDYPGWLRGFPGGSAVKNPPANAGDVVSIPGSGRSPGEGNDNPLQYSCLENPMVRGAWRDTVHGVTKESDMTQGLRQQQYYGSSFVSHTILHVNNILINMNAYTSHLLR